MKKFYTFVPVLALLTVLSAGNLIAAPAITLTTPSIAAASVNQGTSNVIVYAVKMKVATTAVSVNNIQFTLGGNFDANDITSVYIYYNASAPVVSGASFLNSATATFAAPHVFSVNINRALAVGEQGYFIIVANLSNTATDNHYVQLNGATNPVVFGYSVSSTVTNNQANNVGKQTIQASDITLNTPVVDPSSVNQGTTNVVVYATKMKVLTEPVSVNNIQFNLIGNYDVNDITSVYIYYNASAPVVSGASFLNSATATFAAPHSFSVNINRSLVVGEQGYFIIVANFSSTATDNKYVQINGDTDPVVFSFTTAPNITNNQSNLAKKQTIQASDITLNTPVVNASSVNQGTSNVIVYAAKMKVLTEPVSVNNIQFNLIGNYDANDITSVYIYYNASAPVVSGASFLNSATATFAAPHSFSVNINRSLVVGEQGYFIIVANFSSTATDNKYVQINGDTDPVVFSFTTAPNITNNQSNLAKKQTIQASDITLNTPVVDPSSVNQGTTNVVVYATKMKVLTEPVSVNNIQFNLIGNYDANDITSVYIYYNASAPVVSGASFLNSATATFAAPHSFSVNINRSLVVGEQGYFIIVANFSSTATDNKYVQINGDTDPVVFSFTTAPNITNNQSNLAKKQTIQASDIVLTSATIPAGNILRSSTNNIVYAAKMKVSTEPVSVNNIQFNLTGTHDNDDLTSIYIYYNATSPVISGASFLNSATATFAAPHLYSVNINRALAVGEAGYFIIVANVSATATFGHTVKINGATDPVIFSYTTGPNVTNSQANNAGAKTIASSAKSANENEENMIAEKSAIRLKEIFPNPANTSFSFSVAGIENEKISAQLSSRSGNILIEKHFNIGKENQYNLNVSSLLSGVYYLTITNSSGIVVAKQQVIVQH